MKTQTNSLLTNMASNRIEIERAMGKAVRDALADHKQAGNSVAVWRDGQVVIVSPEDIVIPPDPYADCPDEDRPDAAATPALMPETEAAA